MFSRLLLRTSASVCEESSSRHHGQHHGAEVQDLEGDAWLDFNLQYLLMGTRCTGLSSGPVHLKCLELFSRFKCTSLIWKVILGNAGGAVGQEGGKGWEIIKGQWSNWLAVVLHPGGEPGAPQDEGLRVILVAGRRRGVDPLVLPVAVIPWAVIP